MNWICIVVFVSILFFVSAQYNVKSPLNRRRREAVGSLDIVTNHAQPIHADVKNEQGGYSEKCSKSIVNSQPSKIEPGVVFQVLPPQDTFQQSLRKSFPLITTLDLVRAVSRLVTLIVLVTSAAIEFYPILQNMYETVHELINYSKF